MLQVLRRGWKRLALMAFFQYDYLSPRMLKGLAAYKYKAGGYTWLDDLQDEPTSTRGTPDILGMGVPAPKHNKIINPET